ncbi:FG-GAP-like repeat-containing protein [Chitinophaga sp. LS1]|uniref:FG-GAP-like repeat-containing protein n=1 Tax=Chitinophaga sp. LS1 TaxID=3051176 RepID=UPI002AABC175|nr:FG-GAP-like repeat-containing protein [Chitinophaga sp. LS1]WPV66931.1 FG-GAP-like repeat-containing protein [Chitinophaga sp. LS1]
MFPFPKEFLKKIQVMLLCLLPMLPRAQTINTSLPVGSPKGASGVSSAGGSTYSIPIKVLSGTNSMTPTVNLMYNSQSGDGVAGWGWNLSCMSVISRAGKSNFYNGINTPVKYTNTNDAFVLDGQRMFATSGTNGANGAVYGLENEQFTKIESFGGSETLGPAYFKVTTKDGTVLEYGNATNAKMTTDDGTGSTMMWFLNKVTDISGNYQVYVYTINTTDRTYVLSEIQYTGNATAGITTYNKIIFTYTTRTGWQNSTVYDGGASLRRAYNLSNISIKNASAQTVRSYDLAYTLIKNQYFLQSFTEKGSNGSAFNPLVFSYGANTTAPDVTTSVQYSGMNQGNVYAGDFDGDSQQDVLESSYYLDNNSVPHYTSYDVMSHFSTYAGQPAISYFYQFKIPESGVTELKGTSNGYYNFQTFDYDGDGKDDVVMLNTIISGSDRIYNGIRINYSRKFNVYSGAYYDSVNYTALPHSSFYTQDFKYVYRNGTTYGNYFVAGDFDGDGAQDYILILGINYSNAFKGFFSSPKKGIYNQEIALFGVEGTSSDPFYANSIASAKQLLPIDFDGDGKREILVVKDNQSYVLSVYPVSASSGYSYAAQVLYTFSDIKGNYPTLPGDFNGDGKTDLLYRNTPSTSTGSWFQLTSTGKAYTSQAFGFYNRPYLAGDEAGTAHHLVVADFNGDGKSDVWHSLDLTTSSSRHTIYYSNGLTFNIEHYNQAVSTNGGKKSNTVVGDFNGDGKPDILSINSSNSGRFIYPKPMKEERFLTKITDGLGAQEGFNYVMPIQSGYYSRSAEYEYDKKGVAIGAGANGNPYNVLFSPLYLVKETYKSNGVGTGLRYTSYEYTDACYSPIRGFLGFKKVKASDESSGIVTTTENDIHPDYLIPYRTRQTMVYGAETLSDTKFTTNLLKPSSNYLDKRVVVQVPKTLTINGITGEAAETTSTFDNYGNTTQSVTKVGSVSGDVVTPIETSTITSVYGTHGTPFPASPESITTKNVRNGQAEVSKVTTYAYNTANLVSSIVEFSGKAKAYTTNFTYDAFGNVKQRDLVATGLPTRSEKSTYDNTGRFLLQSETVGADVTKKQVFTYETSFGLPATVKSADGLTTGYQYDVFGRLNLTTLPEGYSITQTMAWESTSGRYSVSATRPGGGNNQKIFYDLLGREVRMEMSGYNGGTLVSSKSYNAKGELVSLTAPYYSTETPLTTTYQYDNYGRTSQVSNGTVTTNYSYSKLAGGQYKTTVTSSSGQSSSQTEDASGMIIAATDNAGSVGFVYDSRGNKTETSVNGVVMTANSYDEYGNETGVTDKHAGTYSYQYDAFRQLVAETNPQGQTRTLTYDPFGRVTQHAGPEGTTTYEYWKEASTGYCNDNLTKVTGFDGDVTEYTYDNLRRSLSEKITTDGNAFNTQYGYDAYNNLTKITYPSGVTVSRTYDRNGTVTGVQMGEGTGATTLFTASGMNSLGYYTGYSYGNGKSTTESYNLALGAMTQTSTPGVFQMNYSFDPLTGNLNSRKDMIRNLDEVFTYDNTNRLLTSKINNVQQLNITYDGAGSSFGNIKTKTDAGNYTYNDQKVNALAFITNPAGSQVPPSVISQLQQDVTYTAFNRTSTITEGSNQLTYAYGADYGRIKGTFKQNGALAETRYYLGGYERQIKGSVTRDIHYIEASNGIGAILTKEGSAVTVYYVYHDYLGSILTVTDASGNVIASQNFDAWGRYRNPSDWSYNNVPNQPEWLYRGFTGHEHLKDFSLINMNGRMYDPVLGRMMSLDNFVSVPGSSQGYNRYAYGLNNPLVVRDPNGEWIHIVVGAAIGGVLNLTVKAVQGKIHNVGDGFAAFGIGAAAGAVGAATGGAALSMFGLQATTVAGGAVAGFAGAVTSSPVQGIGNAVYFGDKYTLKDFGMDVVIGTVVGGASGYIAGRLKASTAGAKTDLNKGRTGAGGAGNGGGVTGKVKASVSFGQLTGEMPEAIKPNGGPLRTPVVLNLAKKTKDISLGIGELLADFSASVKASPWWEWGADEFEFAFQNMIRDPEVKIHFNLTMKDGKMMNVWEALKEGANGYSGSRVTSWELFEIKHTGDALSRTIFYYQGRVIANPFLGL